MLEERLSHTYGQHNLGAGYGAQHSRPTSSMYPSLPSGMPPGLQNGASGAESFYTGRPPPVPESYSQTPVPYGQHPQTVQPSQYDNPAPALPQNVSHPQGYQQAPAYPQRAPSFQGYASTPSQKSEASYSQESPNKAAQPQVSPLNAQPSNPSFYNANPAVASPATDPAQYYQGPSRQSTLYTQGYPQEQPQATPQPLPEQYPQLTPVQQQAPSLAAQPSYAPPQQIPSTQAPPQQGYQPTSNPNSNYWQPQVQSAFQGHAPSNPPPASASASSYTQSSFPMVPSHQPQPKPVEEALIEL